MRMEPLFVKLMTGTATELDIARSRRETERYLSERWESSRQELAIIAARLDEPEQAERPANVLAFRRM